MELQDIVKPSTIEEALILKQYLTNSLFLAGGTDLILKIRKNEIATKYLIDLNIIDDLKVISINELYIEIGSMVTFSEIRENSIIKKYLNSLIECAQTMGSPQIRNMATIGGNIINASPSADAIPCIMALNGVLVFKSSHTVRNITCVDYFKNYSIEKVKENELLTKILIPKKSILSGFYKLGKRNSLAIARLSASIVLDKENDLIKNFSIALGAVSRYPFRVNKIEDLSKDRSIAWLFEDEILTMLEYEVIESIKGRKTMNFKKEAIKGVYKNALQRTVALVKNER